jgi:hypothetical protein
MPSRIRLSTASVNYFGRRKLSGYDFIIEIDDKGISNFNVSGKNILISVSSCPE